MCLSVCWFIIYRIQPHQILQISTFTENEATVWLALLTKYLNCTIMRTLFYIFVYYAFERGSTVFHEEQEVGAVALSGILYMGLGTKNVQFTFRYPSFVHKVARTWEQQMVE